MRLLAGSRFVCVSVVLALVLPAHADEGMWLMNRLPREYLKKTYGFEPTAAWIEHVQKACVKFGGGGSASFVSPNGLAMTNHHVGSDAIADVSDANHDFIRDGFYAATQDKEIRCPNVTLSQLIAIEDVTQRVSAKVPPAMSPAEAQAERDKAIAQIEREAKEKTGLAPQVVKLYHGARYHLYQYKEYDDVRLVMAPEQAIAFFGGDIDNFEYPRYDLDISFFRAYEGGKPAKTEHYFKWSTAGPKDGELVFMAGNPARTRRMYTIDHLKFLRDVELPLILNIYNQREVAHAQFALRSDEHRRIGNDVLFGTQNGRKAFGGILAGLLDETIMQRKQVQEAALLEFSRTHGSSGAEAWPKLSAAIREMREYYPAYFLLENRRSSKGRLFDMAFKLVRAAQERERPDSERMEGYRQTDAKSLESDLFSEAPIYDDLEKLMLTDALTRCARILGGDHRVVKAALAGQTPDTKASEVITGTKLKDLAFRKQMYDGGHSSISECADSMIRLALVVEPLARELKQRYDKQFTGVENAAYAAIAEASFAKYGEDLYPDATHTLRLSIGTVKGYEENGKPVLPFTTMAGAFEHAEKHQHRPPFTLPESWIKSRDKLKPGTPLNFVSTNDIIGGNSGSPAFSRDAQIVGIVFDGNIQSLVWDIEFDQQQARAVSVHSQAILEALRTIYGAHALVGELEVK